MDASIIIGVFNRPEVLDWQLASIARQNISYSFETVVMNDGLKTSGAKEICDKYKDDLNIRYYFTGQRHAEKLKWRSFYWAVNVGIQASVGTVIIIGCDTVHLNDTIDTLVKPIIKDDNKKIWSQAGVYQDDNNKALPYFKHNGSLNISDFPIEGDLVKQMAFKPAGGGFYLCGLPRKLLIDIGGFDEDFTGRGYTDNDMFNRLMEYKVTRMLTMGRGVHLWHSRSDDHYMGAARGGAECGPNLTLLNAREKIIIRNKDRKWGAMPPQQEE